MQSSIVSKIKNIIYVGVWRKLKGFTSDKIEERWKKLLLFLSATIHADDSVK